MVVTLLEASVIKHTVTIRPIIHILYCRAVPRNIIVLQLTSPLLFSFNLKGVLGDSMKRIGCVIIWEQYHSFICTRQVNNGIAAGPL